MALGSQVRSTNLTNIVVVSVKSLGLPPNRKSATAIENLNTTLIAQRQTTKRAALPNISNPF
jgi:hypothetical protein